MTAISDVKPHEKVVVTKTTLRFVLGILLSALNGVKLLFFMPYGIYLLHCLSIVMERCARKAAKANQP